jgi:hypothetical protein
MRRSVAIIILILSVITIISSCKKSAVAPNPMLIPWNMDSLMSGSNGYPIGHSQLTVSGILIYNKLSGNLTDTAGHTNSYLRNWEAVLLTGIGAASVNTTPLGMITDPLFGHYDSTPVWNESALNHWNVTDLHGVTLISVDIPGTVPAFTGILPVNISTTSDFAFVFNSSNTVNADSAFVIVYGGGPDIGSDPICSNVVNVNGGVATISADILRYYQNEYTSVNWSSHGTSLYYGGQIMFVIYNHTIQTIGGKQYAFVKQREYLGIVKFL